MNKFLLLVVSSLLIFSCKKPSLFVPTAPEKALTVTCELDNLDFDYLSSKGKIQYKDAQNDHKTNFNLRIKKDSIIWISINAAAGFEAFRILILSDSIHILDKIKNQYTVRDYNSLSKAIGVTLNYSILQSLVIGNLMNYKEEEDVIVQTDSSHCSIKQFRGNVVFNNIINSTFRKIENVEISDGSNTMKVSYRKFIPLANYSFPSESEITVFLKNINGAIEETKIYLGHNKTEFPEKGLNFPFNVPAKFERR